MDDPRLDPRLDERGFFTAAALDQLVEDVYAGVNEEWEERAAHFEYENGWLRNVAEQIAWLWCIHGTMPTAGEIQSRLAGDAVPE